MAGQIQTETPTQIEGWNSFERWRSPPQFHGHHPGILGEEDQVRPSSQAPHARAEDARPKPLTAANEPHRGTVGCQYPDRGWPPRHCWYVSGWGGQLNRDLQPSSDHPCAWNLPIQDARAITFKGKNGHTWALVHGTSVLAAQCILLEGFIRPADWTYHQDYKLCQLPTFGAYALGMEVSRCNSFPHHAALDLLDRATKKGKGQQPVLIGALYRGKMAHLSFKLEGRTWLNWRFLFSALWPLQRSTIWRIASTPEFASLRWPGTSSLRTLGPTLKIPSTTAVGAFPQLYPKGYRREPMTMKASRMWRWWHVRSSQVIWTNTQTGNRLMHV